MNYFKTHKIIALFLAVLMILPLIPAVDLTVFAEGSDNLETISNELAANVGKQAIFDWWWLFYIAPDNDSKDAPNLNNIIFEEYENLGVEGNIFNIVDYYYDDVNGEHWYKISARDGETLPATLEQYPWITYTTNEGYEYGDDPYLCIYENSDTIKFITSELIEYQLDEEGNTVLDDLGNPIIVDKHINYYIISGPAELESATVSIERIEAYKVSSLACVETTYYTTFSKGYSVSITKADGTGWSSADGTVAIRYEEAQFGDNTYTTDPEYGAAFLYVGDNVYSAEATEMWGYESSDVLYTNSASSTIVFEIMPEDFAIINKTGYPTAADITVYNNTLASSQTISAPSSFEVLYSFTQVIYEDKTEVVDGVETTTKVISAEIPWYWLDLGSEYCFVKQDSVTFESNELINTKVIIKPSVTSVDVYFDPRTDVSDYLTLDAALFDGVYKVTDTYYSATENILFYGLAPCEYMIWPEETGGNRYVSSEIVEETDQGIAFPIVDFCNPAPIMGYTSQIQPRSAIYGARSAIASPALYSTNSSISTYANDTASSSNALKLNKTVAPGDKAGTYKITLEAYTTGTVEVTETTIPMDIVLVLDQSGSMEYCIGCSRTSVSSNSTHTETTYTVASKVSTNGTYYRKNGSNYTRVYYCSYCDAWLDTNQSHYRTNGGNRHQNLDKYSDSDTFYTATTQTVRCQSRLDALKTAVTNFVDEVNKKAKGANGEYGGGDDVNHRIAIVGFANYSNYDNYNNTEVFVGATGYKYGTAAQGVYSTALQDVSTESGYNNVISSKNALDADGATYVDLGIEMANGIFAANPITTAGSRNRVMIVFTDGVPGYTGGFGSGSYESTGNGYNNANNATAVANEAIDEAKKTKATYGATVYTVGVFDGADASNPTTLPANDDDENKANRYMHLVSSNWPTATSMTNTGTINDKVSPTQSYYMSASSTTALNNIFVSMSSQVGGTPLPLDSKTVVKDIITPQFTLPANASAVQVYSEKCTAYNEQTGTPTWGGEVKFLNSEEAVTIDTVNHCVDVTGFDFAHNYVAQNGRVEGDDTKEGDFHGRRLVIVFTITPDPDFLGGDGVATNGTQSGIYSEGKPIAFFSPGSVNVPLKDISTIVKNKHIYYGNTTDLTGILDLYVKREDQQSELRVTVDGINNAYVKLLYTVKLNDSTVAQYYVPAGEPWGSENCTWSSTSQTQLLQNYQALIDTGFSVECSMISAANTGNVKKAIDTATVYVYKPTLEFKDSEQKYRDDLNPNDGFLGSHFVGATWSHPTQNSTIEGTAPSFAFTFDHAVGAFDNGIMNSVRDVPVNVTVTINGTGTAITNNQGVTFTHSTCNHPECAFNPATEEFIVHVVGALTSLKIQKFTKNQNGETVSFENIDPNQTFLFRVMGKDADGNDINVTVTVHAKDGFTIVDGLVIGNQYTVQELTDWSWRYTCKLGAYTNDDGTNTSNSFVGNTATLTITALGEKNNVATFENTRNTEYWLDGDSWCDNRFMANVTQAIN